MQSKTIQNKEESTGYIMLAFWPPNYVILNLIQNLNVKAE